jgi:hypothetical protein
MRAAISTRARPSVAFAALAVLLPACTVTAPADRYTRLWSCETESDCIDGWACVDRNVLGEDFCRPACDPVDPASCDGVCTRSGECLARCTLRGDNSSPCPPDHQCVRFNLLGDEGVCFPAPGCSQSSDCDQETGTRCLNNVFDLPAVVSWVAYSADHLDCIAVPDAEKRCAAGYLAVPGADDSTALCLPRCDSKGSRCPPVFTCLRAMGYLFEQPDANLCVPGGWGLPCDDDAQCIIGRCLEVGEGRRACTLTCEEAARIVPGVLTGCEVIERGAARWRLGAVQVECEDVEGTGICVPRGTPGAPCNEDMLCAPGLECRAVTSTEPPIKLCTRDCSSDQDCPYPGAPITSCCRRRDENGGICLPRS